MSQVLPCQYSSIFYIEKRELTLKNTVLTILGVSALLFSGIVAANYITTPLGMNLEGCIGAFSIFACSYSCAIYDEGNGLGIMAAWLAFIFLGAALPYLVPALGGWLFTSEVVNYTAMVLPPLAVLGLNYTQSS